MIVVWSAAEAFGAIRDAGELVEDERADHREDHGRDDRPDDLEPRRAVNLRAFGGSRPLAAPVLDDERDQRSLDDHEDEPGEDRDEDERGVDAVRVRRMGVAGQETAVTGVRNCGVASATILVASVAKAVRRTPDGIV